MDGLLDRASNSKIVRHKMQTDYGSSSISQQIAAEWFTNGLYDEHLRFVRSELKNEEILCY